MTTTEIRTRKTKDPEMDAILIINQALSELDRAAAKRVLAWADKRFVNIDEPLTIDGMQATSKFMQAIEQTGRELTIAPPAKILNAMSLVVSELVEQRKLEPAEA